MSRIALWVVALCIAGCSAPGPTAILQTRRPSAAQRSTPGRLPVSGPAKLIVDGAKAQLDHPARFTQEYFAISYPNGDVPTDKGACVDVVIRALRHAGYDLQELIHDDMKRHFAAYPRREARPDPNIDHRRVPNQRYFFTHYGLSLSTSVEGEHLKEWKPGDIVTWKLNGRLDHTGVVVDDLDAHGYPLVIHNLGETAEEDVLTHWAITGHYRFPK